MKRETQIQFRLKEWMSTSIRQLNCLGEIKRSLKSPNSETEANAKQSIRKTQRFVIFCYLFSKQNKDLKPLSVPSVVT